MRRLWRANKLAVTVVTHAIAGRLRGSTLPPERRDVFRAQRQTEGSGLLCDILGVRVSCVGQVPDDEPMLCVSNHIGMLDPFVLASQWPMAFAAKAEIQSWPVFGRVAETYGVFFVERGRPSLANSFVSTVRSKLDAGVHVMVFPEGRTNAGETLLPFKTGAFEAVAGRRDSSVLPVYLHPVAVDGRPAKGARRDWVVWADSDRSFVENLWRLMQVKSIEFEVRVGDPFAVAGRGRKQLAREAYDRVAALAPQP